MISPTSEWENVDGCAGHLKARTTLRTRERPCLMGGSACRIDKMQHDPQLLSTPCNSLHNQAGCRVFVGGIEPSVKIVGVGRQLAWESDLS